MTTITASLDTPLGAPQVRRANQESPWVRRSLIGVALAFLTLFLFVPLALAVVFSLLASYVLSFTLVPMLSRLLLVHEHVDHETHAPGFVGRFNAARDRMLDDMERVFETVRRARETRAATAWRSRA